MPRVTEWLDALAKGVRVKAGGPLAAAADRLNNGEPVAPVLDSLLTELAARYDNDRDAIVTRERQLTEQEGALRQEFIDAIVEFVSRSQPGAMSPATREILRAHTALLRQLKVEVNDIGERVLERGRLQEP
jgi:hypothetical protein